MAYLASLTEGLPRRPVIEDYIRIVKDKSLLRRLMGICSAAIARAADQSEEAIRVLDATEEQLLEVTQAGLNQGLQPIDDIVRDSFGSIDKLYENARQITGLATGFTDLDNLTSGLQKGDLIIIAARPSMGKTALAINIAQNAAVRYGARVAVFSLEMSKQSILRRMLASQAWVDQQKIQKGLIGREDHEKLQKALSLLVESRIFIDDIGRPYGGRDARQGAPPEADRRRPRSGGGRLPATDVCHAAGRGTQRLREPCPGGLGHLARPEGHGQGVTSAGGRALAALPRQRAARGRQAPAAERPARVRLHRAGRRRGRLYPPRVLITTATKPKTRPSRNLSSPSSATAPPIRST